MDLVRALEDRVGDRLAHLDVGDLRDDVVQALDVLDVERRVHVDPGIEELEHVVEALAVARPGDVRVRQLVEDEEPRPARERRVEVELLEDLAPVVEPAARKDGQPHEQRFGLRPPVRLHRTDHHVQPFGKQHVRGLQHAERLPDAGCEAEEDLELRARRAAVLRPHALQERLRIGTVALAGRHGLGGG